jgi:hypothetical protein
LLEQVLQPLSWFEVRKRRLAECRQAGMRPSEALHKARQGEPLSEAESVMANSGMLPTEAREAHEAEARGENPWRGSWKPQSMLVNWRPI